jgi:hypothetical protein
MDKVKHEIESALLWLEEGNIERVKLHLGFALQWRNDEAVEQGLHLTGGDSPVSKPFITPSTGSGIEYLKRQPASK